MTEAPVLVERRGEIALLTLNRPDKHNALSLALLARLETLMRELGDDPLALSPFGGEGIERPCRTGWMRTRRSP